MVYHVLARAAAAAAAARPRPLPQLIGDAGPVHGDVEGPSSPDSGRLQPESLGWCRHLRAAAQELGLPIMPPKSALGAVGDGVWGGLKLGWRGAKATAKAGADAIDASKQRRAESAADAIEREHREAFESARPTRTYVDGAQSALYRKHAREVQSTNTFGLSAEGATQVKAQQARAGGGVGGFFQARREASERAALMDLATEVGWNEGQFDELLLGMDDDLAGMRSLLEGQLQAMKLAEGAVVVGGAASQPEPEAVARASGTEMDALVELASRIGWDADMVGATVDGLDGDMAAARAMIEEQVRAQSTNC
jgi:hypothetical protein